MDLILKTHKEQKLGARRLEKIIEFKHGVHIPHNKIHKVLLEHDLAKENRNKKKRRKAWIRYEREHSLTAVHLDWHTSDINELVSKWRYMLVFAGQTPRRKNHYPWTQMVCKLRFMIVGCINSFETHMIRGLMPER